MESSGANNSSVVIDQIASHWAVDGTLMLGVAVKITNKGAGILNLGTGFVQIQRELPQPAILVETKKFNEHGIVLQPEQQIQFCLDFPLSREIQAVVIRTDMGPGLENTRKYDVSTGKTWEPGGAAPTVALQPVLEVSTPPIRRSRDWVAIVFAALAVVVGTFTAYLATQPSNTPVRAAPAAVPRITVEVQAIPVPPPQPPVRNHKVRPAEAVAHPAPIPKPVPNKVQAAIPAPHPQGIIKEGMKRDQLPAALGDAYLKTYTADHGQLLEVDAYPSKDPSDVTVTELRDGVVTSTYRRKH